MTRRLTEREMWQAARRRDASYDGIFFLAVRTTGVFCRPSCPARQPRPENVQFFAAAASALRAGYRPCKRCRPLDVNGRPPDWIADLLGRIEQDPAARWRDDDLQALGFHPARVRRGFKEHFGMTFQAYQRTRRLGSALTHVRGGEDLLQTALETGYESNSGFRTAFERLFGDTPGRSRKAEHLVTTTVESPIGPIILCASDRGLSRLEFAEPKKLGEQIERLRKQCGQPLIPGESDITQRTRAELARYFSGELRRFTLPLDYTGTPFQVRAWEALCRISYGETVSYQELAERIGRPTAQRAVGLANNRNRIAIVIPCHRVVNKSGQLGGYGGGLWRKQFLLDLERGAGVAAQKIDARTTLADART